MGYSPISIGPRVVSAFYGRENTLAAYKMAVENKLKLFSYGDGMLIL